MGEGQSEGNEMKFEKSSQAGSDQVQRSNGKSGEIRKDGVVHPRRNALDSPQATKPSSTVEPVQLGRQFRGNNGGFTDELTMKAHELKKLFAEIKTHALVDQSYPSGKERATRFLPHHGVTLGSDWSPRSVSSSGSLRGEFYERYMEKRESKMREQWKARRAEKEMKLRTLWDCFNRISIELRATSLGPADGYKSIQESRSKVEKLLSVNMRSSTLCIQQGQELKLYQDNGFMDPDSFSSAPQCSAVTVPQSSAPSTSGFASPMQRGQRECLISQSLANASNLQQKKVKHLRGCETGAHSQRASFTQRKSNTEALLLKKEEKPGRQSQAMKMSSTSNSHLPLLLKGTAVKHSRQNQDLMI